MSTGRHGPAMARGARRAIRSSAYEGCLVAGRAALGPVLADALHRADRHLALLGEPARRPEHRVRAALGDHLDHVMAVGDAELLPLQAGAGKREVAAVTVLRDVDAEVVR